jgi:hypothetical protein
VRLVQCPALAVVAKRVRGHNVIPSVGSALAQWSYVLDGSGLMVWLSDIFVDRLFA